MNPTYIMSTFLLLTWRFFSTILQTYLKKVGGTLKKLQKTDLLCSMVCIVPIFSAFELLSFFKFKFSTFCLLFVIDLASSI